MLPLSYWGKVEGAECFLSEIDTELKGTKTRCPTCRKAFFPMAVSRSESMFELLKRLRLCDRVYEIAGTTLSEKEEHSQKHVWEFVDYCLSVNESKLTRDVKMKTKTKNIWSPSLVEQPKMFWQHCSPSLLYLLTFLIAYSRPANSVPSGRSFSAINYTNDKFRSPPAKPMSSSPRASISSLTPPGPGGSTSP